MGEDEEGKGGEKYGDEGRLDLGWRAHNAVEGWHIMELYTCYYIMLG